MKTKILFIHKIYIANYQEKFYIKSFLFLNIENYGWRIADTINDLVVYENKQNAIKLYSRIADNLNFTVEINEGFVEELYKSNFINKVIIDVGPYLGESAIYFAINEAGKGNST